MSTMSKPKVPYHRLVEAGFPAKINNSAQGSSAPMQPHPAPGRAAGTIEAGKKKPHQKACFSPVRLVLGHVREKRGNGSPAMVVTVFSTSDSTF